jgi:predicted alpha/beta hydrolase
MTEERVPLSYVGHSFGGHALGLLPNHDRVARAYLFAMGALVGEQVGCTGQLQEGPPVGVCRQPGSVSATLRIPHTAGRPVGRDIADDGPHADR